MKQKTLGYQPKSRFGLVELLMIAVLVLASAAIGFYIYKTNQIQGPRVADVHLEPVLPEVSEIRSTVDVSTAITTLDSIELDAALKQLDELDAELR